MSAFKAKRVSGAELAGQLSGATAHLPSAMPAPPPPQAPTSVERPRPPKKVQINFQASEAMAALIAREADKEGSTRRFFARLMRGAGYDVPEADVNPPDTRRKWGA